MIKFGRRQSLAQRAPVSAPVYNNEMTFATIAPEIIDRAIPAIFIFNTKNAA